MNRIILLLLALIFCNPYNPPPADAWMNCVTVGGGVAGATCATPTDGDRFNQGWETGESTTGWTKTAASDPEVSDDAATLPGTPPTGACAKGYRVSSTGTVLKDTYNTGVASTSAYFRFSFYVASHSITNGNSCIIYVGGSNADATQIVGGIRITNNAGTLVIKGIAGANVSTGINISATTWYTVTGYIEKSTTEGANWLSLDGGSTKDTWTANNTINNAQYHHVGAMTASRTLDIYFGHVQGDSNGF